MKKDGQKKCFQCGCLLVLVKRETRKVEGSCFPQTISIYRCTNKECQERKDKEEEKRLKMLKEKRILEEKKLTERKKKRASKSL